MGVGVGHQDIHSLLSVQCSACWEGRGGPLPLPPQNKGHKEVEEEMTRRCFLFFSSPWQQRPKIALRCVCLMRGSGRCFPNGMVAGRQATVCRKQPMPKCPHRRQGQNGERVLPSLPASLEMSVFFCLFLLRRCAACVGRHPP